MTLRTFAFLFFCLPAATFAQDICETTGGGKAISSVQSYFSEAPRALFTTQLHLQVGFGFSDLTADGKWGPMTKGAICSVLSTYFAINGYEAPKWGRSETVEFADWIEAAAFANTVGGDFPD